MGWEVEGFSFRLKDGNSTVCGIMKRSVKIQIFENSYTISASFHMIKADEVNLFPV